VTVSIGSMPIGQTVASPGGTFSTNLQLDVAVGHDTITADCGITLSAGIDVVLSTQSNPPTATAAILLILLLVMIGFVTTQVSHR
jgi:hypothetical protein